MYQLIALFLLSITEIIGDFALENYANSNNLYALGLGCFSYIGVVYFLIKSLVGSSILYVNTAWDGISTLIETFAAIILLGERFEDHVQYIGLGFVIIGMFLLKIFKKNTDKKTITTGGIHLLKNFIK
jgi:multidrug transporter EmrE-like cation transporter